MLGCSDTVLAAALASKVGLAGRACLLDESADRVSAAAAAIEQEGALAESLASPLAALPLEPGSFGPVPDNTAAALDASIPQARTRFKQKIEPLRRMKPADRNNAHSVMRHPLDLRNGDRIRNDL